MAYIRKFNTAALTCFGLASIIITFKLVLQAEADPATSLTFNPQVYLWAVLVAFIGGIALLFIELKIPKTLPAPVLIMGMALVFSSMYATIIGVTAINAVAVGMKTMVFEDAWFIAFSVIPALAAIVTLGVWLVGAIVDAWNLFQGLRKVADYNSARAQGITPPPGTPETMLTAAEYQALVADREQREKRESQ